MSARLPRKQNGSAILPFVIVVPFLILIATYFMNLAVTSFKLARADQMHTHAQFASDAGVDFALQQINQDNSWAGTGTEVQLHNDGQVKTTYQVTVTDNSADSKTLTAVGRTYRPVGAATVAASVTVKVDLRPVKTGDYSIVTGVGGLFLSNSAKIVGGDVLVNGEINMSNSSQIGLTTNPVNVEVAHQTCPNPPDATYPRLCASGENGQPISLANTSHIYGTVKANNQTSGTGMTNPGLVASSGVAAQPLPNHDRAAQKAAITTTQTGAWASCDSNTDVRTWPANLKITGNVSIKKKCKITISGDVWITGTLDISGQAQLIVANALGATRPDVMVDGAAVTLINSATLVSNASNIGMQMITYKSAASCSPDCANVTGLDLYNSRNTVTISLDNAAAGAQSIFYARWSRVQISNSGQIGALVGQTVELKNSGTITFGTTTSPGSGTAFWIIEGYRRSF